VIRFKVNGVAVETSLPPDMPLLWVLRDEFDLTGAKYGCGIGQCGACTVHLAGQAVRSCVVPLAAVADRHVTTIEGLSVTPGLHPVQRAWIDEQVPQCGYCQPGMIMATAALIGENPAPSDADIDRAITNICRCGTYPRIRRAVHQAARLVAQAAGQSATDLE
jgi:isoquinoline 1-oxidoreductase alpha subunit